MKLLGELPDLVEKLIAELRSVALDEFVALFHAVDWKEPWVIGLVLFHFVLLLMTIVSRKNTNFQMSLFVLAWAAVYLGERINSFLGRNWESFAAQNYFDSRGIFLFLLWFPPLLVIIIAVLANTFISMGELIVRWNKVGAGPRDKRD